MCRICRKFYNNNNDELHLCPLREEKPTNIWPDLAFLNIEFEDYNVENCATCFEIKSEFRTLNDLSWKELFENKQFPELCCEIHKATNNFSNPLMFLIYKEDSKNKGVFFRHVITNYNVDSEKQKVLENNYFSCVSKPNKFVPKKQLSCLQNSIKTLLRSQSSLLSRFLSLIYDQEWSNTVFIIQDCDSFKLVNKN